MMPNILAVAYAATMYGATYTGHPKERRRRLEGKRRKQSNSLLKFAKKKRLVAPVSL